MWFSPGTDIPRFTLIKMLVVIAIVAVLATLAMPNALTQTNLANSTPNLKQVGVAMQLYLNNRGFWPSATSGADLRHWRQNLVRSGYFGDGESVRSNPNSFQQHPSLQCPLQAALHPKVARKDTFAMNRMIGNQATLQTVHGPSNPFPMERVHRAALVSGGTYKASSNAFELTFCPSATAPVLPMAVYRGNANVLFADGHTELGPVASIPKSSAGAGTEGSAFWRGQ